TSAAAVQIVDRQLGVLSVVFVVDAQQSTMLSKRASSALAVCFVSPALLAAAQDACTVGTVQDNCVSATSEDNIDEFFFCTDRY
ncbi:unnamed protein product, partial [Ectocarpus sp. 12 AP-2014]